MDHQHYSDYVQATNELNTDRETNHLPPVHVMTFDEWKHGIEANAVTTNSVAPANLPENTNTVSDEQLRINIDSK